MMINYESKILAPGEAAGKLQSLKAKGGKIVFTNGCFDLLHKGHLQYLQKARGLGSCLVAGLNSDSSVRSLKGKGRPVNSLDTRLAVMASLFFVDFVTWFEEETPIGLISGILPDVLVKGGDWAKDRIVGADLVERNGGEVLSIDFLEGHSSTSVIERIQDGRGGS